MVAISELVNNLAGNFSINEAFALLKPLSLFIMGIAIYSIFIFKFYRFVARREILKFNVKEYSGAFGKFFYSIIYLFKYLIVFPILSFFWFIVIAGILAFLSKQSSMQIILLISIALVAVIRVTAYYTEELSKDLAKMLPFALLGVFLVDISFFSFSNSLESIKQLPSLWKTIVYYLIFIVLLEFILSIFYGIGCLIGKNKQKSNILEEEQE